MKIINYTAARDTLRRVLDSVTTGKPVVIKSKASAHVLIEYNQYLDLIDKVEAQEAEKS